jgi:biopolymer transport protein ExbB
MKRQLKTITASVALSGLFFASRLAQAETVAVPASSAPGVSLASSADSANAFTNKSLLNIVRDGGLMMYPLFGCSFVLLVFAFERFISLRTGRVIPGPFVKRFLHQLEDDQLDRDEALLVCEENGSPVAKIFSAAARKWGRPAVEVEQATIDAGERGASDLRRYLRVFNGVATISPLMGLLGTVFGIIRSFSDLAASEAGGRMEMLSKGISEALFCTAMGLLVAIPAVVAHLYFVSRVDRLVVQLDTLGQEVVNMVSAEAIQEAGQSRRSRKSAA